MSEATIKLFQVLKKGNFSDQQATEIIDAIGEIAESKVGTQKDIMATKQDISDLRVELHQGLRNQLWAIIVLMVSLCGTMIGFLITILQKLH